MDAHFLEYHLNHRRQMIQRELKAIQMEKIAQQARGQRSGRLMRFVRVLFSRRARPAAPQPTTISTPRSAPKLAH